MRFMLILKANATTESGAPPREAEIAAMTAFNEELVKAGVLLAAEGLWPSSRGARVTFKGDKRTVTNGPFAGAEELVAGFWLLQVKSKEEAIEWVKRAPNPHGGDAQAVIELRQVFDADDFGAEFTPELRAAEEKLRAQAAHDRSA